MKVKNVQTTINNAANVTLKFGNYTLTSNYDGSPLTNNMVVVPVQPDDPRYVGKVTNTKECMVNLKVRGSWQKTPAILVAVDPSEKDEDGNPKHDVKLYRQQYNFWQNDELGNYRIKKTEPIHEIVDKKKQQKLLTETTTEDEALDNIAAEPEQMSKRQENAIKMLEGFRDNAPQYAAAILFKLMEMSCQEYYDKMQLSAKNADKVLNELLELVPKMLDEGYENVEYRRKNTTANTDYYKQVLDENWDKALDLISEFFK